jgi:hypothetical protein
MRRQLFRHRRLLYEKIQQNSVSSTQSLPCLPEQLGRNIRNLPDVPVSETDAVCPLIATTIGLDHGLIPKNTPISDSLRRKIRILGDLSYAVQSVGIRRPSSEQQGSRLLQDSPPLRLSRFKINSSLSFLGHIEHQASPQTDGRHDWEVGISIFVRHDSLAGEILIDQAVVDAVRCSFENTQRRDSINDGSREPGWHFCRSEESVVRGELGWDGLQAAVFEGYPAVGGDLAIV